jgi:hypothetical protein
MPTISDGRKFFYLIPDLVENQQLGKKDKERLGIKHINLDKKG